LEFTIGAAYAKSKAASVNATLGRLPLTTYILSGLGLAFWFAMVGYSAATAPPKTVAQSSATSSRPAITEATEAVTTVATAAPTSTTALPVTTTVVATTAPPAPATVPRPADEVDFTMPDFRGMDLQSAQNLLQTSGIFFSTSHDLHGSRSQIVDSNWQVCSQTPPVGTRIRGATADYEGKIDFGVVKLDERCP